MTSGETATRVSGSGTVSMHEVVNEAAGGKAGVIE